MKKPRVALIGHDPQGESPEYYYSSPETQNSLSPLLSHILSEVRKELAKHSQLGANDLTSEEKNNLIIEASRKVGVDLTSFERDEILIHLEKDSYTFGILQPLVDDERISDIIVRSFDRVMIQQGRRNFHTDNVFPNQEEYESFIERLLQKAGTSYSTKKPIADAMVGHARIHVVHSCIAEGGPYLTIRLNRFTTVSLEDLLKVGLAPLPIIEYLSSLVRGGRTLLIAGEVGTGKTTLARALGNSIPHDESILVIEDTPEIKLDHPHVRYLTTRESNTDGAGRVTPSECIRGGMRMAMNRIIFGEIRDAEASEAFIDVCASGHPGLSTIHGRTASESVARLELFLGRAQRGVDERILKEQVANAVDCLVHVGICKTSERRRILEVREIGPVADGVLRHREIFRYAPQGEEPQWRVSTRTSAHRDHLEKGDNPVILSSLPPTISLSSKFQIQTKLAEHELRA